ncbi:bifunctional 2-C-methyl-D-erythritol 4-phosphate cytidylyltransferase/2-C-methyl-D-erythritol 2,4-cyclodiphosphate synthase [Sphingomonas quercus]|uniref:Bifunctional enzyme IspD/IspF n=1 Tax=Sphingomonas quercus TaxID=2842451 RepID=A0ABS6BM48_9SPHN|nr:bifunctional 2-C-methyl-D-erythritol 4-phosphate cytidylyltransferase/2-C-methyl-D-erythritol 2,4-cyclodiphosphate synthase [Sphingomonas quercus]MBU3079388.1 bifunctional 2-C-methyl-D-erythritol 4-phosphate cytidylyltransferase/2-C-methyl-D-erythritol 2,4-cyclodiphosphate synthase [Sphingomonas quercus]
MQQGKRIVALVVAAGQGVRAGGGVPKQYAPIGGKAMIAHAVDALIAHPAIDAVQVVIAAGQDKMFAEAIGDRALPAPIIGGALRQDSVRRGLAAIDADIVLIHDAARPFVPAAVIDRLLAALDAAPGAIPTLPVVDTLARGSADRLLGAPVSREGLHRVQTPQAFHARAIRDAHQRWPGGEATDDAQVARTAGYEVALVTGDAALDKLTHAADLSEARRRMTLIPDVRTGSGYDVHAFVAGDHIWLCGLKIPHVAGLAGHSDADVALHAITDALLGAIGDGDIGMHFPPSDPQWKGAPSHRFVSHARDLVLAKGGRITHIDVTIICEAPKVGPHRAAMRGEVARLLGIAEDRVSVKATTTEGLGFAGRREGIAAQATATIVLENSLV